jgi:hypothetical protein
VLTCIYKTSSITGEKYASERIVLRGAAPAGRIMRRSAARTSAFSTDDAIEESRPTPPHARAPQPDRNRRLEFITDDWQAVILPSVPIARYGGWFRRIKPLEKAATKRRRPALHVFDSSPILTTTIPNSRASALLGARALSKWKSTRKE